MNGILASRQENRGVGIAQNGVFGGLSILSCWQCDCQHAPKSLDPVEDLRRYADRENSHLPQTSCRAGFQKARLFSDQCQRDIGMKRGFGGLTGFGIESSRDIDREPLWNPPAEFARRSGPERQAFA